jgi:hypothetical protein
VPKRPPRLWLGRVSFSGGVIAFPLLVKSFLEREGLYVCTLTIFVVGRRLPGLGV